MPRADGLSSAGETPDPPPGSPAANGSGAPGAQDLTRLRDAAIETDPHPGPLRAALHFVYDVAWLAAALIGSPWLLWKSLRVPGFASMIRDRLGVGLGSKRLDPSRVRVLVHGVSVGEVKGAEPLVRALRAAYPELDVAISVTTGTGLKVARTLFHDTPVFRFPADISFLVRRFLRTVRPDFVVLVELEIWPAFLRSCNREGIPVAVVNGRITDLSHRRYHVFRRLLPQFGRISLFCVQSEEYAQRFRHLDVPERRLLITGNVKADGLPAGRVDPGEERRRLIGGRSGQHVLVAGSTHGPEELLVALACRTALPDWRLVLVPRHPHRCSEVVQALKEEGLEPQLMSELRAGQSPDPARPLVVDTIGELEPIYGLADLVYVGGSLIPHGGQNMLEPAAQGLPVLFGPHVSNFTQEAGLLLRSGAARQVADAAELVRALSELADDAGLRERMGAAGLTAAKAQKGATALTLRALDALGLVARLARPS